jgi:hypothetical protein
MHRQVGEGSVLLWNFSPVEDFSNLRSMTQFVVLCQRTVRLAATRHEGERLCTLGQSVTIPLPRAMTAPMVTVQRPGQATQTPVLPDMRSRQVTIQATNVGHWQVSFAQDDRRTQTGFSVNAPLVESDLTPISADDLHKRFPGQKITVAATPREMGQSQTLVEQSLDLAGPVLLVLLALLIVEPFFANRFYKQPSQEPG